MQLVIPRETQPGENRVSATPETVKKLVRLGAEVVIEAGAGTGAGATGLVSFALSTFVMLSFLFEKKSMWWL